MIGNDFFIAPSGHKCMKAYCFLFPHSLSGSNSYVSSPWQGHAEGELSAFSLSLTSLHQWYVPLPWLSTYLIQQRSRFAHRNRTQALLQRLLYNVALCSASWYRQCWQQWFSLYKPQKLPSGAATHGLNELQVRQRESHHFTLPSVWRLLIGAHGVTAHNGR